MRYASCINCVSHLYAFIVVMVNQEEENVKCMSLDFVCFNDTIQCSRFQGDQNSHLLNELKQMTMIYMTSSSYDTIKPLKMRHGTYKVKKPQRGRQYASWYSKTIFNSGYLFVKNRYPLE
jgi:hypothetical protein